MRRYSGDVSKTKLSQRLVIAKQELKQKEQRRKSMAFDICTQIIDVISNSAKSNTKCSLQLQDTIRKFSKECVENNLNRVEEQVSNEAESISSSESHSLSSEHS